MVRKINDDDDDDDHASFEYLEASLPAHPMIKARLGFLPRISADTRTQRAPFFIFVRSNEERETDLRYDFIGETQKKVIISIKANDDPIRMDDGSLDESVESLQRVPQSLPSMENPPLYSRTAEGL